MLEVAGRLILGGILMGASVAKLAAPGSSRAALASFGILNRRVQGVVFPLLIATEIALAGASRRARAVPIERMVQIG